MSGTPPFPVVDLLNTWNVKSRLLLLLAEMMKIMKGKLVCMDHHETGHHRACAAKRLTYLISSVVHCSSVSLRPKNDGDLGMDQ